MKNRIRILATGDIHGHVENLARISTLVNLLRDEETILVDNGDVLEASSITRFHQRFHPDTVSPITKVMKAMHYDFINIGNHDFDDGPQALQRHLQQVGAPCLTHNCLEHDTPLGPTYAVVEAAGKKVAFFGVTTTAPKAYSAPRNIKGFRFQDAYTCALKTVDVLKRLEKPDFIVALYHGSFEKDPQSGQATGISPDDNQAWRMLKEIDGIDLLIAGHEHRTYSGVDRETAYVEMAANGEELVCVDLYTDTHTADAQIYTVDTEPDEAVLADVKAEITEADTWLDTVLGVSDMDLTVADEKAARLYGHPLIQLYTRAAMEAGHCELAAASLFRYTKGLPHTITMRDILACYPFANTLVVKEITGRQLKEYLEQSAAFWSLTSGAHIVVSPWLDTRQSLYENYDLVDGVDYTVNVANPIGSRIVRLEYKNRPVAADDTFMIALNSYRACGGGGYAMLKEAKKLRSVPLDMTDIIADYVHAHTPVHFTFHPNVTVVSH